MPSAIPPWCRRDAAGTLFLQLHIQPGAKHTAVAGEHGEALKIRLAAPPVDGKANAALISFIARTLGVAKSAVSLKSGECARQKVITVKEAPGDALERLLTAPSP